MCFYLHFVFQAEHLMSKLQPFECSENIRQAVHRLCDAYFSQYGPIWLADFYILLECHLETKPLTSSEEPSFFFFLVIYIFLYTSYLMYLEHQKSPKTIIG